MNNSYLSFLCRQADISYTVMGQRAEVAAAICGSLVLTPDGEYEADDLDLSHRRQDMILLERAAQAWIALLNEGPDGIAAVKAKMQEVVAHLQQTETNKLDGDGIWGKTRTEAWRNLMSDSGAEPTDEEVAAI